MKRQLLLLTAIALCSSAFVGCKKASAEQAVPSALPYISMDSWLYNSDDDVYYQTGLSYATTPADADYETLGIYVPGAYFDAKENGDGTYSCTLNKNASVAGYDITTAPYVLLVETPGYSACQPPTGYVSSVKSFTDAGFIYIYPGCRGRDHGAPSGVTDLKAAIRYVRYNKALLPGDTERLFSFGMSGGGAQSALLGSTGDATEYAPYLAAIGAVEGVSDAVMGSMCWCPITNLDYADEAYEWNMGMTRTGLDEETQKLSNRLAESYAEYINSLGLTAEDGSLLTLLPTSDGIYQGGTYYEYVKVAIENSLNNFLSDTSFPYSASSEGRMTGGRGTPGTRPSGDFPKGENFPGGTKPDMADYTQRDNIQRTASTSLGLSLTGTYQTAQDYVDALNTNGNWVTYDENTNTVTISSIGDFAKALKNASKSVGAFDDLNATQGENTLFGYGSGAHFDSTMAAILTEMDSPYAAAYNADIKKTDSLGTSVQDRINMYTPLFYLNSTYAGYKTATVASFWRIRSGISQGDTALCTELNLALALKNYGITDVDFETVWGQQHVKAERTGDSTENFIAWVNECLSKK